MLAVLRWGTEWLSLKRQWMERAIIAGYGVSCSAGAFFDWHFAPPHRFGHFDLFFNTLAIVIYAVVCASMWRQQKRPEAERIHRLLTVEWIVMRSYGVFVVLVLSLLMLAPPRRWFDIFFPVGMSCYAAFQYAISLPEDGERGKKRKLALAKLKAMFGTSWVTAPVPQPQ